MTPEARPIPRRYTHFFLVTTMFSFSVSLLSTYYELAKMLGLGDTGVHTET